MPDQLQVDFDAPTREYSLRVHVSDEDHVKIVQFLVKVARDVHSQKEQTIMAAAAILPYLVPASAAPERQK